MRDEIASHWSFNIILLGSQGYDLNVLMILKGR